ncbi:unnamed protein product [Hermetia illucens]|uniref:Uncharacterized protein n=1 Tax=Hermetia illucens TaxID=343691 RepID=A0A7R8UTD2_HERIL|nr:unnamed protein product [Hermetia illucens]
MVVVDDLEEKLHLSWDVDISAPEDNLEIFLSCFRGRLPLRIKIEDSGIIKEEDQPYIVLNKSVLIIKSWYCRSFLLCSYSRMTTTTR